MFRKFVNALLFIFHWIYRIINKKRNKEAIYTHMSLQNMDDKTYNIFALSDYSLIHIFKYVSSTDLYNLSLTCKRFEGLVKEKKLWHKIDARDDPNTKEKVKYCIDRINERTTDFLIRSEERDVQILPDNFFTSDACWKLSVLALENQLIRGDLTKLSQFPKSLVELSLRKSFINSHSTFFKLSYMQMENLKVLILDECGWVETYMLVQMSKYAKLEVLSLYKCKKLSDNDIAYLSLAGCYGFKQLRILDIRFTGLGDQILKTFYKHPTLQELYFQSYASTYILDKTRRRLEIARGSPVKSNAYFSKYDDIPDTDIKSMEKLFGYHSYRTCRRQNLSNHGTVMYKFVIPNIDDDYVVHSVLYKSPYGECTCGYGDKLIQSFISSREKDKDLYCNREEILKLKNIIKDEKYKKHSPYMYVLAPNLHMDPYKSKTDISSYEEQASENNKKIDWINAREPLNLYEIAMFEHADVHSLQSDVVLPFGLVQFSRSDIILGRLGPSFGNPNAADAVQDSLSDCSEYEDQDKDSEDDVSEKLISLEDSDVIAEELYESYEEGDEQIGKGGSSELNGVKSENSEEIRQSQKDAEVSANKENLERKTKNEFKKCKIRKERLEDSKSEDSANKENLERKKCKICGAKIVSESENDQGICKECEGKENVENHIIRFKLIGNKNKDKQPSNSKNDKILEIEPDLPSTSKTQNVCPSPPSATRNSKKRKCDNSTNVKDNKKLKTSDENRIEEDYLISCEVEEVNPPMRNMVYININMPEQFDNQPGMINVPMDGGLINIILGGDTKTKAAIKKLSLRGFPKITDCTLDYLTTLKLDLLDVTKTGISRSALRKFIRQNPTCRVLHESACICQPDMHF